MAGVGNSPQPVCPVMRALCGDHVAGERTAQYLHRLSQPVDAGTRGVHGDAGDFVVLIKPPGAKAELDTSVAELVEG